MVVDGSRSQSLAVPQARYTFEGLCLTTVWCQIGSRVHKFYTVRAKRFRRGYPRDSAPEWFVGLRHGCALRGAKPFGR